MLNLFLLDTKNSRESDFLLKQMNKWMNSKTVCTRNRPKQLFSRPLFFSLTLGAEMIDLSIGDKKLFSIMRLLPPPSHFPWAIIAGLSERPVITTGLGPRGKSILVREGERRAPRLCTVQSVSVYVHSTQGNRTVRCVCLLGKMISRHTWSTIMIQTV